MLHNEGYIIVQAKANTEGLETIISLCKIAATANAPTQNRKVFALFFEDAITTPNNIFGK
jgi:hypothetical protein